MLSATSLVHNQRQFCTKL